MRKLAWWFCMFGMTLRRALYRPVFLLFLLIFPLGMGVLHQVEKRDSGRIAVALCPGTGCVESGACRKTGIGREPFIFLLSVRDGGRGKEGGYDRTGGVRLPVSREIKRTAGRGALYPCGPACWCRRPQWQRKLYQKRYFLNCSRCMGGNCWRTMGKWSGIPDGDGPLPDDGGAGKGVRRADGTL